MILFTKVWRERIGVANDPYALSIILHELFMLSSYKSKFNNLIGLASTINETARDTMNDEMFNNLKAQMLDVLKWPIIWI